MEGERAVEQLNDMIKTLGDMEVVVERNDLPRLFLFKKRAQETLDSINKSGLSHMATIRTYQTLIVVFRFSSAYLQRIRTKKIDPQILHITEIVNDIVKQRGFDDSPYTKLTESTFTQVRQLFVELTDATGDATLRSTYNDLLPALADAVVKGSQGDRPEAFAAGIVVYQRIKSLYPFLNSITRSESTFNVVLNIQALTEFYGEYAQRKD